MLAVPNKRVMSDGGWLLDVPLYYKHKNILRSWNQRYATLKLNSPQIWNGRTQQFGFTHTASCLLENTQHASVRRVHTSHAARDGSKGGVNVFLVAKVSVARMHTHKRTIKPFTLLFKLCHEVCQKNSDRKKKFSQQLVAAASCLNHTSFGGLDQPGGSHMKGRSWLLLLPNVYKEGVNCIIYKDTKSYFELIRPQKDRPAVLL